MKTFNASRPSPAMVVAVLALVFAMVGSAIAGTDGLSSKITKSKVKKIAKKQANKKINQREASLNVNSAKTADNATNAVKAQTADKATTADSATTATTADTATNATNAENAVNATNAETAANSEALGGVPAANFSQSFFAKVNYSNANPTIIAGSAGVTGGGEGALGFPRITFPRSMSSCAIIATTSAGAGTSIVRHSSNVSGATVQLAIQDGANAAARVNFSVVGIC